MIRNLFVFVFVLIPMLSIAEPVEIDGIYYNLISKGQSAEVTSNPSKYSGEIVIPSKVTYNDIEYSVSSIGKRAFEWSTITSITIPNSIKTIGEQAFYNCI